jgi:hypothetical protein
MKIALAALLGGATVVFLFPVLMPWGKTLLRASLTVWFVLWGLFFYFLHTDSKSLSTDSGNSFLLGFLILLFSAGFVLRFLIRGAAKLFRRARGNYAAKPKAERIT